MSSGPRPFQVGRFQVTGYGRRELLALGALSALGIVGSLLISFYYLIPLFVGVVGFGLYFFRDPYRQAPPGKNKILAPADGRVVEVIEIDEREFIGEPAVKVSIFLSLFDVHINRAPCDGEVSYLRYQRGRFLNALKAKSADYNENNAIGIANEDGLPRVMIRQIAGTVARRIVCACSLGQEVRRGEKIGMIKFGSRTELYIPRRLLGELQVSVGTRLRAGESVIGTFR